MTTFKRSFQSLLKLRKRTLVLSLIFLLMSTFLLSGSIVKGSLQTMLNSAKKEVNPITTIETGLDSLMKDMLTGGQNSTSKPIKDFSMILIQRNTIKQLPIKIIDFEYQSFMILKKN